MPHTFQKAVDGATTALILDGSVNGEVTLLNPHASEDIWLIGNSVYSSTSVSTAITTQGFRLKAGKALSFSLENQERLWGRSVTSTVTISVCIFQTSIPRMPNAHG